MRIENTCPSWWDKYPSEKRHFYQSSGWGKYLEGREGYRPFYCYRESEGIIKGSLLAYLAPVESLAGKFFKLSKLYWHHGPLLADAADLDTAREIVAALFAAAGWAKLVSGFPPYIDQREVGEFYPALAANSGLELSKWSTFLVSLQEGEQRAWSSIQPEARRSVRKMQALGFEVRWLEKSDLAAYAILLKKYRTSARLALPPFYPSEELWEILGPERLFLPGAFLEGSLRAVWPVIIYQDTCFFFAAAHDPELQGRYRSVNDLVQWRIIQMASSRHCRYYDLAGAAPAPATVQEEGIRRFKAKWGGKYVEYPTLDGGLRTLGRIIYGLNRLVKK